MPRDIRTICKQWMHCIFCTATRDTLPTCDLCLDLYLDMTGYFIVLALDPYAGQYFIDIKGSIVLYMYLKYGTTRHASLS